MLLINKSNALAFCEGSDPMKKKGQAHSWKDTLKEKEKPIPEEDWRTSVG